MLYKFLSGLAKGVTHCIFRVKVVGKENVPKDGGMILAVNHKSCLLYTSPSPRD